MCNMRRLQPEYVVRGQHTCYRKEPGVAKDSDVALAARVKRAGKEFVGDQKELYLLDEQLKKETPHERLFSDAMSGDGALFTCEDAVETAWVVVDQFFTHITKFPLQTG